jgi:ribosomal protein S18 acetylase RimI-like enzyme
LLLIVGAKGWTIVHCAEAPFAFVSSSSHRRRASCSRESVAAEATSAQSVHSLAFSQQPFYRSSFRSYSWLYYRAPSSSSSEEEGEGQEEAFVVRESRYGDMGGAADVIMAAFYVNSTSPWKQLYRLAELNRLQQGFPYARGKAGHNMYVAVQNHRIVGFVDVDARRPNRSTGHSYNPRPYLSDLCIHPAHTRRGIARALVARCEEFCRDADEDRLYIRVEKDNAAAVGLYRSMGYTVEKEERRNLNGNKLMDLLILMKDLSEEVITTAPQEEEREAMQQQLRQ